MSPLICPHAVKGCAISRGGWIEELENVRFEKIGDNGMPVEQVGGGLDDKGGAYRAAEAEAKEITTIEGLSEPGKLHPIQQAFIDHNAFQCSYCTPGFILSTKSLLAENPTPTAEQVRSYLAGNLCRCGSYYKIQQAVLDAAARLRGEKNNPAAL